MPPELDGRYKVLPKHTDDMRKMKENGYSYRLIGIEYNLHKSTVMQRLWPPGRKEREKMKYRRRSLSIKNDPKLLEKQHRHQTKHRRKKYRLQYEEMRAYDKSKGH